VSKAALFHRKLASHFKFFNFLFIPFYAGFGSKSGLGTGTVMLSGSGFAKAKSYCSRISGSTILLLATVARWVQKNKWATVKDRPINFCPL
jgi:hypothetical protein